ncbi:MAG: UGSC family (seleno)protein, partial [Dehalococcoidia bacterium]|nr:UGSC family (seleno)protein [Dehalococcoidia bacterium]
MLTSPLVELSEAIDAVYEEVYERGWTDGLPIIPATRERVRAFVDYTGRQPGEIVGEIPPDNKVATIETVAINAVMAGCRPEYMPVILAAIEAVLEPEFGLRDIQVTTNPATPLLIVNGPIRQQLEINSGPNALGQGWRANATIGRALNLLLRNVGGATPGAVSKCTQGQPGRFTMCLGENEEASPWEPLHVERGLSPKQSAVTVVGASGNIQIYAGSKDADRCLTMIAHSITVMGTNNMACYMMPSKHSEPVIIMCPSHAQMCADLGMSKQDVKRV